MHEFIQTAFSAQDQHVFSFSHWAYNFLALFSKVHEFVQNSVFSPRSERFVIFALGTPPFSVFSKVHEFVRNRSFKSEDRTFCHFRTGRTTLKTVCLARDHHVFPFSNWARHFLALLSKVHEFVPHHFVAFSAQCTTFYETEVLSPRSERVVIFALGALLFSDFQQSARVCTKQRFQKEITAFCHFFPGYSTF